MFIPHSGEIRLGLFQAALQASVHADGRGRRRASGKQTRPAAYQPLQLLPARMTCQHTHPLTPFHVRNHSPELFKSPPPPPTRFA